MMLVACHTVAWGGRFDDSQELRRALEVISTAGFEGVELYQPPSKLGVTDIQELTEYLDEYSLQLVGISSGSLEDRLKFLGARHVDFLSVSSQDTMGLDNLARASTQTLSINPHILNEACTLTKLSDLLKRFEFLKVILDTAHVFAAGHILRELVDSLFERLVGVHLKDWRLEFSTASFRFAKGFCNLGEGNVPLDDVVNFLRSRNFKHWLIWNLDNSKDPEKSTFHAASWCRAKGLITKPLSSHVVANSKKSSRDFVHEPKSRPTANCITATIESLQATYQAVLDSIQTEVGGQFVSLWENTEIQERLNLLASTHYAHNRDRVVDWRSANCVKCIGSQQVELDEIVDGPRDMAFAHKLGLHYQLSIPIIDSFNSFKTRFIATIAFEGKANIAEVRRSLESLKPLYSRTLTLAVENECLDVAFESYLATSEKEKLNSYSNSIARIIKDRVLADFVSILLRKEWSGELEVVSGSRHNLAIEDRQLCSNSFASNSRQMKADFDLDSRTVLAVPLRYKLSCPIGVVLCVRLNSSSDNYGPKPFTDIDAAIVDAAASAVVKSIGQHRAKLRRDHARQNLHNDLGQPAFAMRASVDEIRNRLADNKISLEQNLIPDMKSWLALITRLIRQRPNEMVAEIRNVERSPTLLVKHVIAAVVRQSRNLLSKHGISHHRIEYRQLMDVPALVIDRNRFQQVFLNLISNSVKNAYRDPSLFRVEIGGRLDGNRVLLFFRDWGQGIPREAAECIFEETTRYSTDLPGEGLGLAMVRKIVAAHEGHVFVSNFLYPTEFTLVLPSSLIAATENALWP